MQKMSTTHLGLLAIVLIAGIWLFMQNAPVEAQQAMTDNVMPALSMPLAQPTPAASLASALAMLNSNVSAVVAAPEPAPEQLTALSPDVHASAAANHQEGVVVREKIVVDANRKGFAISAWEGATGMLVGTIEHPIQCAWVADGWTYTGPVEHLSFATQNAMIIPALRDLCEINGGYGVPAQ